MASLPEFQMDASRGRFTSWLYAIVRNKATDMMRRQARRPAVALTGEAASGLRAGEADPAVILERHADRQTVRTAMSALRQSASDLSYRVLHLRYVEGLGAAQVAESLGLTREQVWVREHRMKRELRGILDLTSRSLGIDRGSGDLERRQPV